MSNERPLGYWINRSLTFLLVVIGWVFFRAADVRGEELGLPSVLPAWQMLAQMAGAGGWAPDVSGPAVPQALWGLIAGCWVWCNFAPNSFELVDAARIRTWHAAFAGAVLGLCFLRFGVGVDFLYFRF